MGNEQGNDTLAALRERMEERRRVTLTEGRMLLNRLEDAASEIARLQESLARARSSEQHAAPSIAEDHQIPDSLAALLERAGDIAAADDRASLSGAIYAWCSDWLNVRSQLLALLATEQQIRADIERLEQQASAMTQQVSTLIDQQENQ